MPGPRPAVVCRAALRIGVVLGLVLAALLGTLSTAPAASAGSAPWFSIYQPSEPPAWGYYAMGVNAGYSRGEPRSDDLTVTATNGDAVCNVLDQFTGDTAGRPVYINCGTGLTTFEWHGSNEYGTTQGSLTVYIDTSLPTVTWDNLPDGPLHVGDVYVPSFTCHDDVPMKHCKRYGGIDGQPVDTSRPGFARWAVLAVNEHGARSLEDFQIGVLGECEGDCEPDPPTEPPTTPWSAVATLEQQTYPSTEWTEVADSSTLVAGNPARIRVTGSAGSGLATVELRTRTVQGGEMLVPPTPVTLGSEPNAEWTLPIDTTGWAWDAQGQPRAAETGLTVQLLAPDGGSVDSEIDVQLEPRPVVLVHGYKSNAADSWGGFQSILETGHPELHGWAVGDGQVPGQMNTGSVGTAFDQTYTIAQNAFEEGKYISGVQQATGAWHVDIAAHSMGGLISRYYIQNLMRQDTPDDRPLVNRLIQLGTPNMGSELADLLLAGPTVPLMPATLQLSTSYVQGTFNSSVTNLNGVPISNLAGTEIPMLGQVLFSDLYGDGIVPRYSARWTLSDVVDAPWLNHVAMTGDQRWFDTYVLPRLADPDPRTADTNSLAGQRVAEDGPAVDSPSSAAVTDEASEGSEPTLAEPPVEGSDVEHPSSAATDSSTSSSTSTCPSPGTGSPATGSSSTSSPSSPQSCSPGGDGGGGDGGSNGQPTDTGGAVGAVEGFEAVSTQMVQLAPGQTLRVPVEVPDGVVWGAMSSNTDDIYLTVPQETGSTANQGSFVSASSTWVRPDRTGWVDVMNRWSDRSLSVDLTVFVAGSPLDVDLTATDPATSRSSATSSTLTASLVHVTEGPVVDADVTAQLVGVSGGAVLDLLDDGQHGDGEAGDGIYGASVSGVPAGGASYRVSVDSDAGSQIGVVTINGDATEPTGPTEPTEPAEADALAVVSGDTQQAAATKPFITPLVVSATAAGAPVLVPVTAAVTAGSASFPGGATTVTVTSGADGRATFPELTAGTTAGPVAVTVTSPGAPDATASAIVLSGPATALEDLTGGGQQAAAGDAFGQGLGARAVDAYGNTVAGVPVTFTTTGPASFGTAATATVTTGADGRATAPALTAGTTVGAVTVTATSGSLPARQAELTVVAGPLASLLPVSGGNQRTVAGTGFAAPLVVSATDRFGNPVTGVAVDWAVRSGTASFAASSTSTGADGRATSPALTAGTTAGQVSVVGSNGQISASYAVRVLPDVAAAVGVVSGDGQTTIVGSDWAAPLTARVTDRFGNPITGVAVTFAATAGRATWAGATSTTVTSGADGTVTAGAPTAGTTAGPVGIQAYVTGVTPRATFALTATPGTAATLVAVSGGGQSAPTGSGFAAPLVARAVDAHGNPVAGVPVTFAAPAATGGAGVVVFPAGARTATVTTSADGLATSPALTTQRAGAVTVTATAPGTTGAAFGLAVTAPVPARADLSVSISAPIAAPRNGTVSVQVTVTNRGPAVATGVQTGVVLPSGWTVTGAGGGRQVTPQALTFSTAQLASGATATYTVTARVGTTRGIALLGAGTLSGTGDPNLGNNAALHVVLVR